MWIQGLYSLSGKTSYRKISWSLEAARFGFKVFQSLWNLAGTWAALLPRCLSNCRAIRPLQHPISWPRDFTRFGGTTSYRLVNRGPGSRDVRASHYRGDVDEDEIWKYYFAHQKLNRSTVNRYFNISIGRIMIRLISAVVNPIWMTCAALEIMIWNLILIIEGILNKIWSTHKIIRIYHIFMHCLSRS